MRRLFFIFLFFCQTFFLASQTAPASIRVEPMNWWTGLKHRRVEVLVQAPDIASYTAKLEKSRGVNLVKTERAESPNYLFLTLDVTPTAPAQTLSIRFRKGTQTFTHAYPILARSIARKAQGISSADMVYLIFPDRFANGDPANDKIAGMQDTSGRLNLLGRHGGDLKGITDHLDYIQDLGATAIWLNPELENDQPQASYHGYAVTDHYRVDRRFGTNEQFRDLVAECHRRGLKVVRDVVINHIGSNHYWMKDLPSKDWLNQWPQFTRTTYRAPTLVDPYASDYDTKMFNDGWFDIAMPDLNQRNPHVANYLIQQAIWWVEFAGIDDFRIDTYTYSDQKFMSRWCEELRNEYPQLNMVGEIWEHGVVVQGFFADNQPMQKAKFDSNLPGVIDFQFMFAVHETLTKPQGWTDGVGRLYYTLAKDRFYQKPYNNLIMLDNHDISRIYSIVGQNLNKLKSGIALLATMRGIPQLYYATEILSTGFEAPSHGNIRKEFPGGWPGDKANKFTAEGRTTEENEAFNFTRALFQYRKKSPVLHTGKLMQFVPVDGLYVYFRYNENATVMVVINTTDKDAALETARFAERMKGFTKATNIATGEAVADLKKLTVGPNSPLVLELH